MTSDTIRQKFIYNTPYDDNEFPLVIEDDVDVDNIEFFSIKASYLYCLEEYDFIGIVQNIKSNNLDTVIIKNDYSHKSSNKILIDATLCHIMAFVYLFKKNGLNCKII